MEKILIGKIVNTHGIKGELKILSDTDFKDQRYRLGYPLFIKFKDQFVEVNLKQFRPHQGFDLLTFTDLEDINLVEKYRGSELYAENVPIKNLNPNEFHADQLIGMEVMQKQILVGTVTKIRIYPQGDYLEITKLDHKTALVPFRSEFIIAIDRAINHIEVIDMEGLI
ncbi:MAG: ribosome maturation factor RimM [Candidatus Izemoplasmatales bacterium]|jgi:16S rRNA processing protein RimM|nr:ribosome maturation factor RimM [Candidatus Izemoplasmatales bacterium]MDD3865064.1 ribosome maturation factor RimM [Candidatus Izemoplasmatales bacterium]